MLAWHARERAPLSSVQLPICVLLLRSFFFLHAFVCYMCMYVRKNELSFLHTSALHKIPDSYSNQTSDSRREERFISLSLLREIC